MHLRKNKVCKKRKFKKKNIGKKGWNKNLEKMLRKNNFKKIMDKFWKKNFGKKHVQKKLTTRTNNKINKCKGNKSNKSKDFSIAP